MIACGQTFIIPESSNAIEHLWMVVTEPNADFKAVCVSVTTLRSFPDRTVILSAGDHPFIRHDSYVFYAKAAFLDLKQVEMAIHLRSPRIVCRMHAPMSAELLERVQQGVLASKQTPNEIKAYCKSIWMEGAASG